jgi:type VI secretion system secreted protein VgrG
MQVDSHSELKAEEHRITHGNRLVELKADDHLTVAGSQHIKLGAGQFIEAGEEIHYFAGEKLVLDAGSELTLKVGGSFIKLDAGGVSVVGAEVKLNSGGSAGAGSGIAVLKPLPPGEHEAEPAAQAEIPSKGSLASSQTAMMKTAHLLGASRCPVCESCREGSCDL